jgi:hypothetical protein
MGSSLNRAAIIFIWLGAKNKPRTLTASQPFRQYRQAVRSPSQGHVSVIILINHRYQTQKEKSLILAGNHNFSPQFAVFNNFTGRRIDKFHDGFLANMPSVFCEHS